MRRRLVWAVWHVARVRDLNPLVKSTTRLYAGVDLTGSLTFAQRNFRQKSESAIILKLYTSRHAVLKDERNTLCLPSTAVVMYES